jgi:hypothetical protein
VTAWVVQGNPRDYDFDDYFSPGKSLPWLLLQSKKNSPQIGDEVWVLLAKGDTDLPAVLFRMAP